MKKKIGVEIYMSLILILETIVWLIIKITNLMEVEWWYILFTNVFSYIIYVCIFYYKKPGSAILPLITMVCSLSILGIISLIPHIKEMHFVLKIWLFFLTVLAIGTISIYVIQTIKNNLEIKKIEENYKKDMLKYEYYRDIINQYSPAILSLVYNRKIKYADILVATILDLKLKNYLEIEDNGIRLLETDTKDMLQNQKFVYEKLEEIKDKKGFVHFLNMARIFSNNRFKNEWKEVIKSETEKESLCSSKLVIFEIFQKVSIFSLFAMIIISFLIMLGGSKLANAMDNEINLIAILILIVIHFALVFMAIWSKKFNKRNLFVKTKEGVDLQCKMSGLKNYIKEYSKLEERELKELVLWEDYMIYAIIFDLKGNLDKEAKKLYEKLVNIK